ncbi:MAG: helix-turn-helix domain-containing protein [Actinomycetota bacterium]|nr:helix-turn-helix domain-containing protein [Actinomycetota bacterium]
MTRRTTDPRRQMRSVGKIHQAMESKVIPGPWIGDGKAAPAGYPIRSTVRPVQAGGWERPGYGSRGAGGRACAGCPFMAEGGRPMMRVLTIDEAAAYLKVSRSTVSRHIADGSIKCVRTGRHGGRVLITEWALIQFLLGEESSGDEGDDLSVRI